jgi:RNA polymerase sigma-70 factor (ECF subfamily)
MREERMGVSIGGREGRYPHLADEDLISLVGSADARAFAVLYDRHSRAAYRLAYRMTGGRQAAEDLTQEAFLKVWRSADSYRSERGSVRTWILSIVHNRGIDRLRSAATRRRTQDRAKAEAGTSAARHEPSEAFAEAWRGYSRERLREALGALPREQREAVTLAHLHGQTHTEIAQRLGLPLGTVKGRMRLGLKKLGEHLGGGDLAPAE